ncbi:MAG: hypothetical protein PHD43_24400 [Methylococcales bacterium]|nr:hypothetical protein [Methylococcales bacterium]
MGEKTVKKAEGNEKFSTTDIKEAEVLQKEFKIHVLSVKGEKFLGDKRVYTLDISPEKAKECFAKSAELQKAKREQLLRDLGGLVTPQEMINLTAGLNK